ncbi:serine/threonine protein kinase [Chloropicon primus]|uniref:non-specific serine/threonine protein kinase n=1 Tax=Chloropicon primus TaxID=1764295 RepID=A0A5B8N2C3_9CHLO|nr:serine/threonine protein kinase [Chloropicon primus]UPR05070.1 serine/threonine protein kinase [Chloropicon primus]|eukprot:QDZ25874.1 serine/threonine protein kinase [Chloropicon primus]
MSKTSEKLVEANEETEPIPVETDPTGRYHRYDDVLGRGAYKTVYKGFDGEEGIEVAWNQIRVNKIVKTEEEKERLFQEVDLLKELSHKSIIKFYASWIDEETQDVNFITEMFTSGTLRQYRKRHKKLDEKVIKSWTRQILRGLLYLHGHDPPIIHRDLKADNIFVNGNQGELKIGDLGLATLLRTTQGATSVLGTPEFMAPELYEEDYDERVDIYALGMCLLELVTFEYPYQECENAAQIYKKVSRGIRPAALERVEKENLKDFITSCISDIENRPSARELLDSEYLYKPEPEKKPSVKASASFKALDDAQKEKQKLEKKELEAKQQMQVHAVEGNGADGSRRGDESLSPDNSDSEAKSSSRGSTKDDASARGLPHSLSNGSFTNSVREAEGLNGDVGPSMASLAPEFRVRGKVSEENENVLYMKLKIKAEGGVCNTVSFLFDCTSDSAASVAAEMVQEFSWTPEDQDVIEAAIQEEVKKLTNDDAVDPPKAGSPEGVHHDPSAEITVIEHEIEELCRQQKEEEIKMKRRHEDALQKVKHRLEETKLRCGVMSPRHASAQNGFKANVSQKPQTQEKIMQMQAKALEGLGGLGMNGDGKTGSKPNGVKPTQGGLKS